jgi:hypothetical protein
MQSNFSYGQLGDGGAWWGFDESAPYSLPYYGQPHRYIVCLGLTSNCVVMSRNPDPAHLLYCAFINNSPSIMMFSFNGPLMIRRTIFRGNTCAYGLGSASMMHVYQCLFDVDMGAAVYNADNQLGYVDTITYQSTQRNEACLDMWMATKRDDEVGGVIPDEGSLTDGACDDNVIDQIDAEWKDNEGDLTLIRQTTSTLRTCMVIRGCSFFNMHSETEDGGAVSFSSGGGVASISDSSFTLCTTSETSQYEGGAVYLNVDRIDALRVCGYLCCSYHGTFISCVNPSNYVQFLWAQDRKSVV